MDEQRIVVTYPHPVSSIGSISVGERSDTRCVLYVTGKIIKEQKEERIKAKENSMKKETMILRVVAEGTKAGYSGIFREEYRRELAKKGGLHQELDEIGKRFELITRIEFVAEQSSTPKEW